MRYLVAVLSFLVLATNGCDAIYFDTESNLQRLHQERSEIRVLTLQHPLIYYKDSSGRATGIDHDLLMNFADRYGLKIKFIVKKNLTSAYEALAEGEGDLIAARLRQENFALQGYLPGPAYEETHLSLFCHQKSQVRELQDLANKKVALQEKDLDDLIENRLQLLALGVQIKKFEKTTTKKLFSKVDQGQLDCAFAEDLEGQYYKRPYGNIVRLGPLTEKYLLSWVLRPEHSDLQVLMQQWFQKASRRDDVMRIQDRYRTFLNSLDSYDIRHFTRRIKTVLPQYQSSFKSAARHYKMDWRLLGSIAFQESHWEAEAVSYTGVRGIMQLTQGTAKLAGIKDRTDPQQSIWGGAFYFRYLWNRLPSDIHVNDRIALALAAYNMGYGHLLDAQKLVIKRGRNPYSWRDIKAVLPLLSDPSYALELDYGPARSYETMDFVERVRSYYSLWNTLDV